jgi:cell division septation protein DedD
MAGAVALGFLVGRDIIGERYVRRTSVPVRVPYASARPGNVGKSVATVTPLEEEAVEQVEVRSHPKTASPRPSSTENLSSSLQPKAPKPKRYTVQVGVFLGLANSRLLQEDLKNRGYSSHVSTAAEGGQKLTRVRVGSYPNPDAAAAAAEEMWQQGYRVVVVPED